MTTETPADDRLEKALTPLLNDLAATNAWIRDLDGEIKAATDRRAKLIASADNILQAMDKRTRDIFVPRYVKLTARAEQRTRKINGILRHVLEFLLDHEFDHIRGAELTWYVQRWHKCDKRYGPNTLRELARTGHVSRTGHGVYRINRMHPEMLAIRLEMLGKAMRRH